MLRIQVSTLNTAPYETPRFIYQLCSSCAPIFAVRAVPGYIPGACNDCILDAVFDLPSFALGLSSSTSTGSTLSSIAGIDLSPTGTSILSQDLTSIMVPSETVATIASSNTDGGGLVTIVTGTATLTEMVTSTLYFPALPGGLGELGRVTTTCYPVTTFSEFTATFTIPPESCTTYTTTNKINNKVETCTEPVPWWKPSFPIPTQISGSGSHNAMAEVPGLSMPVPAKENPAEPGKGTIATPQLPAGNKISEPAPAQPNNVPLPQANAALSGGGNKDNTAAGSSSGLALPAQPPESPDLSPGGMNVDLHQGTPISILVSPPGTAVGIEDWTIDADPQEAGSNKSPEAAQAIGCRSRKLKGIEMLIAVIGIALLLVCL